MKAFKGREPRKSVWNPEEPVGLRACQFQPAFLFQSL